MLKLSAKLRQFFDMCKFFRINIPKNFAFPPKVEKKATHIAVSRSWGR